MTALLRIATSPGWPRHGRRDVLDHLLRARGPGHDDLIQLGAGAEPEPDTRIVAGEISRGAGTLPLLMAPTSEDLDLGADAVAVAFVPISLKAIQ